MYIYMYIYVYICVYMHIFLGTGNFNRESRTLYIGGLKLLSGLQATYHILLRHLSGLSKLNLH
jgi:hypothetical protein